MAGLIREDDIAEVREKARIEDVVSQYVTLKPAGGGALKGLCPFHDEKSPSFNVRPGKGSTTALRARREVITWLGLRSIRELARWHPPDPGIAAAAGWTPPSSPTAYSALLQITLTRNRQTKELFATDDHRWFARIRIHRTSVPARC